MIIICVIPARYESSRFPGKPLAIIKGHPMISWVYHRAKKVSEFSDVIVATDDKSIFDCVLGFGGKALMTSKECKSGTDRVAEVAKRIECDIVVNLQGDEPLISSEVLSLVCKPFINKDIMMVTPVRKITDADELANKNSAWVVKDKNNNALYFSRSVIPAQHKIPNKQTWLKYSAYFKHIGIYAYRKNILLQISELDKGVLEKSEDLEQLRIIENGFKIHCVETIYHSVSVDVPDDILKVNEIVNKENFKLDFFNA